MLPSFGILISNFVCLCAQCLRIGRNPMWPLLCLSHHCLHLIAQQDGKQLLSTKQHSDATCSPAVFLVQFFLFNPWKEIKEQYFHFACPAAVSLKMTEEVGYPSFTESMQLGFILMVNNNKYCRFSWALHSGTGQAGLEIWLLQWLFTGPFVPAGMGPGKAWPNLWLWQHAIPLQFHNHNPQTNNNKTTKSILNHLHNTCAA